MNNPVTLKDALEQAAKGKRDRDFPGENDARAVDGSLFPRFTPKFTIDLTRPLKVFTIGSCFARNIEWLLHKQGVSLPTQSFQVPEGEYPEPRHSLINEYNPGTIAQRILYALGGKSFPDESLVPSGAGKFADLLLPGVASGAQYDVSFERAIARRRELDTVYAALKTSDLVVLTLGFVETWFDTLTGLYLNRMPPLRFATANPDRFTFVRMDVDLAARLLDEAVGALAALKIPTIVTVSPVPLHTTFTGEDCVLANEFSKSVLRVCADRLHRTYDCADYFPSYEIVRSGGGGNYNADNVHVTRQIIEQVTAYMLRMYAPGDEIHGPAPTDSQTDFLAGEIAAAEADLQNGDIPAARGRLARLAAIMRILAPEQLKDPWVLQWAITAAAAAGDSSFVETLMLLRPADERVAGPLAISPAVISEKAPLAALPGGQWCSAWSYVMTADGTALIESRQALRGGLYNAALANIIHTAPHLRASYPGDTLVLFKLAPIKQVADALSRFSINAIAVPDDTPAADLEAINRQGVTIIRCRRDVIYSFERMHLLEQAA